MKQSELVKIIMVLKVAYPYHFKDMTKEDVYAMTSIYKQQFKDYAPVVLMKAVDVLVRKSPYMPSIAELHSESKKQEIVFYKELLERSDIDKKRKKQLSDLLSWYETQEEIPNEIKNEILGKKTLNDKNVLEIGGKI